jgi:hypothetical protein
MPKNPLVWQSLAFKNRNPRDLCIEFDEPTHIYTINGKNKGWISCTGFLHDFFPHFDADVTIKKMMNSSKWLTSPYYGMTADEIKEKWSNSAKEASGAGTALHLAIEMHHNGAEHLIPEDIKEIRLQRFMETQARISHKKLQAKVGQILTVLVDSHEGDYAISRSMADAPDIDGKVYLRDGKLLKAGDFVDVKIESYDQHDLFAGPNV